MATAPHPEPATFRVACSIPEDAMQLPMILTTRDDSNPCTDLLHNTVEPSPCYIMRLPLELRLCIYELFFSEVLRSICTMDTPEGYAMDDDRKAAVERHEPTLLALVHTSQAFRTESVETCQKLAQAFDISLQAEWQAAQRQLDNIPYWHEQKFDAVREASYHSSCMVDVVCLLTDVKIHVIRTRRSGWQKLEADYKACEDAQGST